MKLHHQNISPEFSVKKIKRILEIFPYIFIWYYTRYACYMSIAVFQRRFFVFIGKRNCEKMDYKYEIT